MKRETLGSLFDHSRGCWSTKSASQISRRLINGAQLKLCDIPSPFSVTCVRGDKSHPIWNFSFAYQKNCPSGTMQKQSISASQKGLKAERRTDINFASWQLRLYFFSAGLQTAMRSIAGERRARENY
jgi:hypothetical protein